MGRKKRKTTCVEVPGEKSDSRDEHVQDEHVQDKHVRDEHVRDGHVQDEHVPDEKEGVGNERIPGGIVQAKAAREEEVRKSGSGAGIGAAETEAEAETENGSEETAEQCFRLPRRRLRFFSVCATLLLIGLAGKLALIQLVDQERYAEVAARQQQIVLEGIDKRGTIYDRNMQPLTGTKEEYVYLIKKDKMDLETKKLLAKIDARKLSSNNDRYELYCCADYHGEESETLQREKEAFIIRAPQRYSEDQTAVHVIGYVNGLDGEGVSGLEKDFDRWLSQRDKLVYAVADGANYIIPGLGIQNSTDRDCGLVTTLDADIQRAAEKILREEKVKGTVVVAEARSGEILACASEPSFNPNEVKHYLNSTGSEFLNLAAQGLYAPGSVYKIAVAAAALESGSADENTVFQCKGYEEINGIRIKCSTGGKTGHGSITLRQAFEKSCNCAFIQLGERTGAQAILETSEKLGLSDKTLTGVSGEKTGNLPLESEVQGAGIGNLSIGQGKLLVTPLEICKMTQIVANDGRSADLKLVRGTVENGVLTPFSGKAEEQILSAETARTLQSFMVDTVAKGTANNLSGLSAGGKTGSAEATEDGKEVVHGWFTGFLPAEHPEYVVTVFIDQGGSGRASAVPVFGKVAEAINETAGRAPQQALSSSDGR